MIRDRFWGKTWIYWAQVTIFGALGTFAFVGGLLFGLGMVKDANGEPRPQAGPPMVMVGLFLMTLALMAAFNIAGRFRPTIRCYREGIECNLVGAISLPGFQMMPRLVRLAWAIFSLQGFRSQLVRASWSEFQVAEVQGIPAAYVVVLSGTFTNLKSGRTMPAIAFRQVEFVDHPNLIASTLMGLAANPHAREPLPSWSAQQRPTNAN